MARSAVLNIIFGAETGQLERALGGVQKRLRRTAGEFQRLGDSMSRSVSLPIIGVGAAAIKSAADLETLETSFISLAGGAEQASQLVSQLNDFTAQTPFQLEQVGAAARQLIAAGTPIQEVQNQLQFLGDIAATSGSNIDEIASIFSKVQAKGKVELESLNQLAERGIPIFKALSEATGLPADALGAGAVSVEQFNSVLSSFSEEGGFAAGAMERLSQTAAGKFSTALDNLKLAGAELGSELLPLIKDLLDDVVEAAQSFTKLDDSTKKLIIRTAALGAAFGPVAKGIGSTLNGVADLKTGYQGLIKRGPQLLKFLTNPWTIAAGVIAAAGIALYAYTKQVDEAAIVQDRLQHAQDEARDGYVDEQAKINTLLKQYKFYEGDLEQRKVILGQLNDIAPDYFGNLDAEKTAYGELKTAADKYTESIKQQAIQKAFGEELIDIETRRLKLAEELREKEVALAEAEDLAARALRGTTGSIKDGNDARITAGQRAQRLRDEVSDLKKEINAEGTAFEQVQAKIDRANESLASIETTTSDVAATTSTAATATNTHVYTLQELQSQAFKTEQALAKLYDDAALGIQVDPTEVDALKNSLKEIEKQIDTLGGKPISVKTDLLAGLEKVEVGPQIGDLLGGLEDVEVGPQIGDLLGVLEFQSFEEGVNRAKDTYITAMEDMDEKTKALVQTGLALGASFGQTFEQLAAGTISGKEALKSLAGTAIDTALAAAQAAAIEAALTSGKFSGPAAPIVIPALIGALTGLVRGAFSAIPAFAQGGLVTGPTLAMVGDNASGKEAIIPFERMGEFMKMAGADRGSQAVTVTGRISGKDIVLSNQRGSRDRSRIR